MGRRGVREEVFPFSRAYFVENWLHGDEHESTLFLSGGGDTYRWSPRYSASYLRDVLVGLPQLQCSQNVTHHTGRHIGHVREPPCVQLLHHSGQYVI